MKTIPLLFYFSELKYRIFYSLFSFFITFFVTYFYSDVLFYFFAVPLLTAININLSSFIATNISEIFISYIKLSLFISTNIFFILIFFQIYSFLVPGLYKYEQSYLLNNLKLSFLLLILSFISTYFFIIPIIWNFFLSFESSSDLINLHFNPKINEYINIFFKLILIFSFCFQLPFFLKFSLDIKIVNIKYLINKRHFFILFFFFIAGIISPPDIYSQIILALICIFFYEITIIFKLLSNNMNEIK